MRSCIRALGDKFAAARGTGRRPHRSQGVGCTTKCSSNVRLFAGGVSAGATAAPRTWLLLWGWGNSVGNGLLLAPGGAARLGRQRQRRASPLLLRAARRSRRARLRLGQGASVIRCNESIVLFDDVFFFYEIPLSLTRGPPCGWGLGRARFYSGAPAGPHLPPLARSGRLLSIIRWVSRRREPGDTSRLCCATKEVIVQHSWTAGAQRHAPCGRQRRARACGQTA